MNQFRTSPKNSLWRRVPIGFRIDHRPNGTVKVSLETSFEFTDASLNLLHRQVLRDYKDARRSVRAHNRRICCRVSTSAGAN